MDYQIPRAVELPDLNITLTGIPTQANPLGVKGSGQAGAISSPADHHQWHTQRARAPGCDPYRHARHPGTSLACHPRIPAHERHDLRGPPRRRQAKRNDRHQHLRPQLRWSLRGQRPRPRRENHPHLHRRKTLEPRPSATSGLRPRRRPDRAHLSPRTASNTRCAAPAHAAPASTNGSPGTRPWTPSPAKC